MIAFGAALNGCSDELDFESITAFNVDCTTETGGYLDLRFSSYKVDGWQHADLEVIGDDDVIFGDWSATDFVATYNQVSFVSDDETPQYFTMTRRFPKDKSPPSEWKAAIHFMSDETKSMKSLKAICNDPFYAEEGL